ncbi:hypothetical protein DY048_06770 [Apilactobacillus timberlakei]|uniref:Uncharacterized protein n=1 Tax=Apilactobacillus timberlakei TaxID=2008380 RepID=A0ABY2YRQ6_9LACO|nr:hypothetical protein DYZ97_06855 [Apilactobacillus timberlakei]TPR12872.1 hypothetical protein DY048_06770 [Apilactobacillus timberlakei]TPR14422.1 hypothetical protein DY052_07275 [Apilactobacillus timberlakei]
MIRIFIFMSSFFMAVFLNLFNDFRKNKINKKAFIKKTLIIIIIIFIAMYVLYLAKYINN